MSKSKYIPCPECKTPLTQEEIDNDIVTHNCDQVIEDNNQIVEEF